MNPNGRIKTIVAVAGMILLTATAASSQGKKTAAKPAPDAEFKKLIAEYYTAWSSMNPNNASKFYAKDAGLSSLTSRQCSTTVGPNTKRG